MLLKILKTNTYDLGGDTGGTEKNEKTEKSESSIIEKFNESFMDEPDIPKKNNDKNCSIINLNREEDINYINEEEDCFPVICHKFKNLKNMLTIAPRINLFECYNLHQKFKKNI